MKVGGLERVLAAIVLSLDKAKYDVQVWCLARGGQIAAELSAQGVPVRILSMQSYYNPIAILRLACLMKREKFDLVHTHGYFASTFGRLAAILASIPVIITHVHSTYYDYSKRNIWIERFLSRWTDRIICISRAVEEFVTLTEGIHQDKTALIYNGVALPGHPACGREKMRNSFNIYAEAVVIIIVASLTENKGHGLLMAALAPLTQRFPALRLIIVGDGPLREPLSKESRRLGIEKAVIFTGIRTDISALLNMADIFVLPSQLREGLGVALIEAMAAGLPVIGTAIGGIPELIQENENGLLVPPGSVEALTTSLEKLISDPAARKMMGQKGTQMYQERFTMSMMTRQIETLYDQLLIG
ncbi:MAG: glycosyltransferase [Syntrophales bacterium]|nr:glycosyltransferase [Syntrophales bacterium]